MRNMGRFYGEIRVEMSITWMTSHLGTIVCFRNSELEHSGVPGSIHERISIEVTLMRSLVDGHQKWPGHFLGRHLKSLKHLQNITNVDTL
jgi:hypothetical protein